MSFIELGGVTRHYRIGDIEVRALDGVDLTIEAGEFVAIMGQSGSGKSTLMNVLGCLDNPTGGRFIIQGQDASTLDPDKLAALRREHFGFIFQPGSDLVAPFNTAIATMKQDGYLDYLNTKWFFLYDPNR